MTMKIGIGWNLSTKISACLRANGLKRAAAHEQGNHFPGIHAILGISMLMICRNSLIQYDL
jgi:hypothetical protein